MRAVGTEETRVTLFKKEDPVPWPLALWAGAVSHAPEGCGFNPGSGRTQEATDPCFPFSLSPFLSL